MIHYQLKGKKHLYSICKVFKERFLTTISTYKWLNKQLLKTDIINARVKHQFLAKNMLIKKPHFIYLKPLCESFQPNSLC